MADAADVAAALFGRCVTLSVGSPVLPVAFPEQTFMPPTTSDGRPLPYLDCRLFLNGQQWTGLNDGKVDQGILQLMVVAPRGDGVVKPLRLADQVAAYFPAALSVPPCKLQQPVIGSPLSEANKLLITIRIPWTA